MAMKVVSRVVVVTCLLVAAMSVTPLAKAQFLKNLLSLLRIQGTLFCTANGRSNGTSSPFFSNAVVQLQCGSNGSSSVVLSSGITNSTGVFSLLLDPITVLVSTLLQQCRLVVTTPLSTCNAGLPAAGVLVSSLQALGNTLLGFITISNIVPTGFNFTQNINA